MTDSLMHAGILLSPMYCGESMGVVCWSPSSETSEMATAGDGSLEGVDKCSEVTLNILSLSTCLDGNFLLRV